MGNLPYGNTTVPATKSIGDIMGLLQTVGFNKTAQFYSDGRHIVLAEHDGIQFRWEAKTGAIIQALQPQRRRTRRTIDYKDQALRIAWRVLWHQIKVACDIIRYEVQDVAEVFGGNLIYNDPKHGEISLAQYITNEAASGKIQLPQIEAPK